MHLKMEFDKLIKSTKIDKTPSIRTNNKEGIRKHNEIHVKFNLNLLKSNNLKLECRIFNSNPFNNLLNYLI